MGQNGQDGAAVQVPATGQGGNGLGQPTVAVQAARERTVSGLQQTISDAEFMRQYNQPRNYGFNTAVGSGYTLGKNTIRACIHEDQTVMDGQTAVSYTHLDVYKRQASGSARVESPPSPFGKRTASTM